jgi:hypothetical protein
VRSVSARTYLKLRLKAIVKAEKVRGLGLTGDQVLLRTTVAAHGQHEHGRVASSNIRIRQGDDQDVTQGRDEHRNSDM